MRYCTQCGGEVSDIALFCPACGVRLPAQRPEAAPSQDGLQDEPKLRDQQAQSGRQSDIEQRPYEEQFAYRQGQGGYYPPPRQTDNPPSKKSMVVAIVGLIMSFFVNPVLTYPVIAYGIYLSNKELESGRTSRTTARTIGMLALAVAVISHILSLALQLLGYNIYQNL